MAESNTKKRDIVLFLGAGFSHDAGLPAMSEFGHASQQDYDGLSKPRQPREAAPMLIEAADVFMRFQQFCKASPTLRDSDVENLETVFCIAEAMQESGIENVSLNGQVYSSMVLINEIQVWLWKVYQQCPLLNKERRNETNPETYRRFFNVLKEANAGCNLTVITTNYDLIYEYLSWKNGIEFLYPLDNAKTLNAGNDCKPYFCLGERDHLCKTVICKLHGSVNYFYDSSEDNKDFLFVSNDLFLKEPICGITFKDKRPAIFAVNAICNIHKKYGRGFMPATIPPTYAKLTQQSWLRTIWHEALDALSKAKKIIFIGYSMPDSDGFMQALMHSALAIRASRPNFVPPQVFVIDKSQKTHQRYQRLFHEIYKPLLPSPFSEATKSVIPEILNKNNC